jgi:tRNA-specific 2-thiouridylase
MLSLGKPPAETKVVVAMSGGVDSSTVAVMLHNAGYQVIGVTLQLYDYGLTVGKKGACCAGQDIYDAKTVADKFGFPHYVLDYESVFKNEVMEDFADSYLRGETPIPCVKCNQSVKFRDLFKVAKDLGADALATGHYVRRVDSDNHAQMHMALDKTKDQSYFLFATTQEQLDFLHFPLGGMAKENTRKLAEEYGIPIFNKPDSQDICFVPDGDYASIVRKVRPNAISPGDIIHIEDSRVVGKHSGIINFTIGQRRGLNIGGTPEPLYVIKIDAEKNRIYVGPESALDSTTFKIRDVNWLTPIPGEPLDVTIKIRSAHQPVPAIITANENGAEVKLLQPQKSVTPGQACVMYEGERVLGGGWITR